jgi:hypothetical protein
VNIRIGFTGTQHGMNDTQIDKLASMLKEVNSSFVITEAHHGDCIGADAEFHNLVRRINPNIKIIGHPGCDKNGERPKAANKECDELRPVLPYLDRNRVIVNSVDSMFVAPKEMKEVKMFSGTWYTWRYAKQVQEYRGIPKIHLILIK